MQTELTAEAVSLLYALDADPVIGVTGRTVRFLNPAAQDLFGEVLPGSAIRRLLPEHIALHQASAFFATARIHARSYAVTVTSMPGLRIFRLQEADPLRLPEIRTPSEFFSMELGLSSAFFSTYAAEHADLSLRYYAARLEQTTDQLRRWINNAAVLRQLGGKSLPGKTRTVDCAALLAAIAETAEPMLARKHLQLSLTLPESPCRVRMTPELFEQMLLNLLSNAVRASSSGDTIGIRLAVGTRTVHLSIHDQGQGFPPGVLPEVFRAYSEGRLPRAEAPHKGYGLPVCFAIADSLNGSLLIENGRGAGAGVHVILPLHNGARDVLHAPESPDRAALSEVCRIGLSDALEPESNP